MLFLPSNHVATIVEAPQTKLRIERIFLHFRSFLLTKEEAIMAEQAVKPPLSEVDDPIVEEPKKAEAPKKEPAKYVSLFSFV